MHATTGLWTTAGGTLAAALLVGGCGKIKRAEVANSARSRAAAHRQQAACGSAEAYDRLKGVLFDAATAAQPAARAKLDTLADYSFVRMTNPVVAGSDATLQITRCHGRMILQMPAAASPAFGGEHSLQAEVDYTAQASADGHGLVYQVIGAEPIIARLAAFDLAGAAYRPPPAIDAQEGAADAPPLAVVADARPSGGAGGPDPLAPSGSVLPTRSVAPTPAVSHERPAGADITGPPRPPTVREVVPVVRRRQRPQPMPDRVAAAEPPARDYGRREYRPGGGQEYPRAIDRDDVPGANGSEETVRAFYAALGAGDGVTASAQVVPEKRIGRIYSPDAISRFYGRLPEPLRIENIVPLDRGSYRVAYRYATGRSRCEGTAIVNVTNRGGQTLIRSIRALNGC